MATAHRAHRGCADSRPWMAGGRQWEQDAEMPGEHTPCVRDGPRTPSRSRLANPASISGRSRCQSSITTVRLDREPTHLGNEPLFFAPRWRAAASSSIRSASAASPQPCRLTLPAALAGSCLYARKKASMPGLHTRCGGRACGGDAAAHARRRGHSQQRSARPLRVAARVQSRWSMRPSTCSTMRRPDARSPSMENASYSRPVAVRAS